MMIGWLGMAQSFKLLALVVFAVFIILSRFMVLPENKEYLSIDNEVMIRSKCLGPGTSG